MKKLIIIISICAFFANIQSQTSSKMSFILPEKVSGDTIKNVTRWIDIDSLINLGYINKRLADTIVNNRKRLSIRDSLLDLKILNYELGLRLGASTAQKLINGEYDGIDTNLVAMVSLLTSGNTNSIYEFTLLVRHELEFGIDDLIGERCMGLRIRDNAKVAGILLSYNEDEGFGFLLQKNGDAAHYVKLRSISKALQDEKNY